MKLRRAHFSIVGGILSALTCLLTASGALAETSVQDQVVVSVFSLPSKRGSSPDQVADYRVLERFQELHPHIKLVSSTPLRIIGQSAQDATALMAIAGGTSPDIIYVNFRQSDTYISQGFLYPLDEYFEKMTEEELAERIPGPVMPVVYRDGPGGKHHWIMPTQQPTATVLMYRRDLFDAAGLDPDRPPRDWEELYQYAQKLADPSKGIYALGFYTGGGSAWSMYTYLCSAGAKAVEQTPDGEWRAAFDSDEAVLAFDFVDRLQKAQVSKNGRTGPLAYRGGDLGDKWSYGQIAMAYNYFGGSQLAGFNPQLVGIAPVPKGPTGKSSAEVNCQMMGIFAGQKDKRVRDAAWEYIAFLNSDEARRIYTEAMVEQGAGRMLSPKWLRKYGHADLAALAPPGLEEQFERVLREGTPEPYGRNCQYVYSFMAEPIDRIYFTDFTSVTEQQRRARIKELLVAAVEKTNEKMIGAVPPEVRRTRNIAAWIVAAVAVAAFGLLVRQVFLWMRAGKVTAGEKPSAYKTRLALALLAPALILILWWHYLPLLRGSLMAFQNFNVMGGSPWVGISNFADVLFDERFWMSLKNSLYYCTLWMAMGFLPPVLLAVMLQEIPKGKILFRVLFYLPAVVSGVVILFMWRAIYDPTPEGILNKILSFAGVPPQNWLDDRAGLLYRFFDILHLSPDKWLPVWFPQPSVAMFCVVFPLAWAHLGPGCIIYLAALKGIPDELYEASEIDGASFFNKLRYIVFPYLKPLLVINMVGAIIGGFKSGDAVLAMTGGGPDFTTHVVGYEIWQRSFLYLRFGHGTAMAWVLGLLLLSFTAYQLKILNKVEFRNVGK